MSEITVRPLLKKDQKRIAGMFATLMDKIDDKSVAHIITSVSGGSEGGEEIGEAQRKANVARVFMELFKKLLANMHDEACAFLADLIGVTPAVYDELPIDIDIKIIEALKARPEVENFFTGALRLYSSTGWFKSTLESLKSKYATASAAMQKGLTK
jgi:hypothetical protein